MTRRVLFYTLVAVFGVAAGVLFSWLRESPASSAADDAAAPALVGEPRPPFTLGAIDGRRVSAAEFDGQVLLINFWATWCAPCREEMPMLAGVQDRYADAGLSIVGIALDEVRQTREFAAELGVNYTILVGTTDVMAVNMAYGNRFGTLPYTVLVDRDGIVRWTHLGALEEDELVARIDPWL